MVEKNTLPCVAVHNFHCPIFLPEPCKNNATCTGHQSTFTCECQPGYTGKYSRWIMHVKTYVILNCNFISSGALCETEINECIPNPCADTSVCVDLLNAFRWVLIRLAFNTGYNPFYIWRCDMRLYACFSVYCTLSQAGWTDVEIGIGRVRVRLTGFSGPNRAHIRGCGLRYRVRGRVQLWKLGLIPSLEQGRWSSPLHFELGLTSGGNVARKYPVQIFKAF